MIKVFTIHLDHNLMKKNKMDSKPLNVFNYLKSLGQETSDLVDEIKDADNDIDKYKLVFIGSNKKKKLALTFSGCH